MSRFTDWLRKEPQGFKACLLLILGLLVADFLYTLAVVAAMNALGWFDNIPPPNLDKAPFWLLMAVIPILAFLEEIIFRFLPLTFAAKISSNNLRVLLPVAVISSIIFGYAHHGLVSIPIQGVGGFLYCLLFLKCGGLKGRNFKALFTTTLAHTLWNWLFVSIAFLGL